jgi:NitT/TauT family transport system substrate-binding protein
MRVDFPSCHSGAPRSGEPGIQKHGVLRPWIPGSRATRGPRNDVLRYLKAFAVTLLVAGSSASADDLKPWRHGLVEAKSDAGFIFMPAKGGFAEKQGLKIDMVQFKGDTIALKAMLAGELDTYEGNPGGPMLAAAAGADIKILGCYWPTLTYGIYARAGIATPADLKGKTFAISGPGSLPDLMARAVLEQNNIPASEVRFAIMGSDSDRFRAVTAGVADAASASTEFVPIAEKSAVKLLVHAADAVPNYIRVCIYTTGKTIAERGDTLAHFLAAEMSGLRHALASRDEAIALARDLIGAKPDDPRAAYIYDEVVRLKAVDPAMPLPMDKLTWMKDLLMRTGNLTKPLDLAKATDAGPRAKAIEFAK